MLFWSAPTWEKYSRSFLKILIFRPRRTFFPKPSETHLKTSPNHSQTHPKTSQNSRKSDPDPTKKWPRPFWKVSPRHAPTCVKIQETPSQHDPKKWLARAGNRTGYLRTGSEDHPTRLISPQNINSLRSFYASKIRDVCSRARRVLPSPKLRPRGVLLQPKWQLF